MITFGYNNKFSSILRSLAAIAIGLVMVCATDATTTVVQIIAAFLFAAGIVSFAYGFANRKSGTFGLMTVNAVVDIVIGLILFLWPPFVAGVIVAIIGIVILVFGVIQILALAGTMSLLGSGGLNILLACLAVAGGIVLIFNPFSERIMSILAGVFLIYYGITDLISMRRVSKAKKEYEIHFTETRVDPDSTIDVDDDFDGIKDVDYHKIDEQ